MHLSFSILCVTVSPGMLQHLQKYECYEIIFRIKVVWCRETRILLFICFALRSSWNVLQTRYSNFQTRSSIFFFFLKYSRSWRSHVLETLRTRNARTLEFDMPWYSMKDVFHNAGITLPITQGCNFLMFPEVASSRSLYRPVEFKSIADWCERHRFVAFERQLSQYLIKCGSIHWEVVTSRLRQFQNRCKVQQIKAQYVPIFVIQLSSRTFFRIVRIFPHMRTFSFKQHMLHIYRIKRSKR